MTSPNAPMLARDDRPRTQRETDFRIRQVAAAIKAEAAKAPRKPMPCDGLTRVAGNSHRLGSVR